MIRRYLRTQKGSVIVLAGLMLPVLAGFTGITYDMGMLYIEKGKIQTAADAGVLAGGRFLANLTASPAKIAEGHSASAAEATRYLATNGYATTGGQDPITITFDYRIDPANTNTDPEINVTVNKTFRTSFMRLLGIETVPITVVARAIGIPAAVFNYAIYSADTSAPQGDLSLGAAIYNGTIYSGANVNCPGGGVTVNGSILARGDINGARANGNSVSRDVIPQYKGTSPMPNYVETVKTLIATDGGKTYNSSQTFDQNTNISGQAGAIPGDIYVQGNLTVSGTNTFTGTGVIMADGDITINSGSVGIAGSNQIFLYSARGNIIFNGGGGNWNQGTIIAYAPNGSVTTGGGDTPFRSIIAQDVINTAGSINVNNMVPISSIDLPLHVKLIV